MAVQCTGALVVKATHALVIEGARSLENIGDPLPFLELSTFVLKPHLKEKSNYDIDVSDLMIFHVSTDLLLLLLLQVESACSLQVVFIINLSIFVKTFKNDRAFLG